MGGRADDFGRDGGGRGDESPKRAIEWPKWRDIARMIIAPISSLPQPGRSRPNRRGGEPTTEGSEGGREGGREGRR